jgi:TolB-like protein/Flp pilus assembly protein TadD
VLISGVATVVSLRRASADSPIPRTVVITPLRNGTGDAAQDYFAQGLSAALTDAVWRFGAVRVVSSEAGTAAATGSAAFGSTVILQGVVTRGAGRVHVNAWLDEASTHRRLWSASYDRPLGDVVAIYDEVARAIAGELSTSLYPGPPPRHPVDPDAYDEYLRGRYSELRWTSGGCADAEPHFIRATQLDPRFVNPYVELAFCYVYPDRLRRPSAETGPLARAAVARALALDPASGAAHALNGMIHYRVDYDWAGAAAEFETAHRLEPNNPQVCIAYGEFLYTSGQIESGLASLRRSLELAPFAPNYNVSVGFGLLNTRRYAEAVERLRRALELVPGNGTARFWLAEAEARHGDRAAAARDYAAWLDAATQSPAIQSRISAATRRCRDGSWADCERADLELAEAEHQRPGTIFKAPYDRFAGPFFLARRHAMAGQSERAMDYLEQAYEARHHLVPDIGIDPAFDAIRDTPRFHEMLRKVGLASR